MRPYKHYSKALIRILICVSVGALAITLISPTRINAQKPLPDPNSPASPSNTAAVQLVYTTNLAPGASIRFSAPTLADLNGDGKLDIVVGTSNGYVVAINGATGTVLWSRRVLDYGFRTPTCGTDIRINSSPAVGRLRAPGSSTTTLGVVIGVGDVIGTNGNGGVIAFDKNGNWLWTRLTVDDSGPAGVPDGCTEGVFASPTIADVNHDGRDEVLFGSFDRRLYVLSDDGQDIAPWPKLLRDTIWSSPAVGDIDGDGQDEIVWATDVGQTTLPCPYAPDIPGVNYCGGSLQVRRMDGTQLPNFPYRIWQAIQSQPVLADLNGDGKLDIIFGSGTYYNSGDSFKVYAINYLGQNLPGWPVTLQGVTNGEPAVADLNGDGTLEVVMGTGDYYCFQPVCGGLKHGEIGGLYAIYHDGNNHPGGPFMWHKQPQTSDSTHGNGPILAPMIADINNDGQLDVIYSLGWEVQVRNGLDGSALIGGPGTSSNMYTNSYSVIAPPAIGDLEGDGSLEIVAGTALDGQGATGAIKVWRPSAGTGRVPAQPFPMFRRSADHVARYGIPMLAGGPSSTIFILHAPGRGPIYTYRYAVQNVGADAFRLSASASNSVVSAAPASPVTVDPGQTQYVTVSVDLSSYNTPSSTPFDLGTVTVSAVYGAGSGTNVGNSPITVPVQAKVVSQIQQVFLPGIVK